MDNYVYKSCDICVKDFTSSAKLEINKESFLDNMTLIGNFYYRSNNLKALNNDISILNASGEAK